MENYEHLHIMMKKGTYSLLSIKNCSPRIDSITQILLSRWLTQFVGMMIKIDYSIARIVVSEQWKQNNLHQTKSK